MQREALATGVLVFDFELFIGGHHEKKKGWQLIQAASPRIILGVLFVSKVAYCARAEICSGVSTLS